MKKINFNDIIFATLSVRGRVIANLKLSGMCSLGDIVRYLKHQVGEAIGLGILMLRNSSQGWIDRRAVCFTG